MRMSGLCGSFCHLNIARQVSADVFPPMLFSALPVADAPRYLPLLSVGNCIECFASRKITKLNNF